MVKPRLILMEQVEVESKTSGLKIFKMRVLMEQKMIQMVTLNGHLQLQERLLSMGSILEDLGLGKLVEKMRTHPSLGMLPSISLDIPT